MQLGPAGIGPTFVRIQQMLTLLGTSREHTAPFLPVYRTFCQMIIIWLGRLAQITALSTGSVPAASSSLPAHPDVQQPLARVVRKRSVRERSC